MCSSIFLFQTCAPLLWYQYWHIKLDNLYHVTIPISNLYLLCPWLLLSLLVDGGRGRCTSAGRHFLLDSPSAHVRIHLHPVFLCKAQLIWSLLCPFFALSGSHLISITYMVPFPLLHDIWAIYLSFKERWASYLGVSTRLTFCVTTYMPKVLQHTLPLWLSILYPFII